MLPRVRGIDRSIKRLAHVGRVKPAPDLRVLFRREEKALKRSLQEVVMDENYDLIRLRLLVEAIVQTLRDATRLKDPERVKLLRCAHADVKRAQLFWEQDRLSGMDRTVSGLSQALFTLVDATNTSNPLKQKFLACDALKGMVRVLANLEKNLAMCREEVANA